LADLREICIVDTESQADMIIYATKTSFRQFNMAAAAMLKIVVWRLSSICISCNELKVIHRCKKRFLRFLFRARFLRFLTFFYFANGFYF